MRWNAMEKKIYNKTLHHSQKRKKKKKKKQNAQWALVKIAQPHRMYDDIIHHTRRSISSLLPFFALNAIRCVSLVFALDFVWVFSIRKQTELAD